MKALLNVALRLLRSGRRVAAAGVVAGGVVFLATDAYALPVVLEFHVSLTLNGSIGYDPTQDDSLVGTSIPVSYFDVKNTPMNADVTFSCVGCVLNFTTGGFTGPGPNGAPWSFASGGSLSLIGGLTSTDPLRPFALSNALLMSGTFAGSTWVSGVRKTHVAIATAFQDVKDPALLEFLGLTPGTPFEGFFHLGFGTATAPTPGGSFASSKIIGGDIVNSPVPEPATMLLFGSGLLAAGVVARRSRKPVASTPQG